ncbi:MAG: hypothetical protein PHW76_04520 [Alphaproteobacteria bacterium]|nr:hypothetical protein [Alphaproteobacteria bacterium]
MLCEAAPLAAFPGIARQRKKRLCTLLGRNEVEDGRRPLPKPLGAGRSPFGKGRGAALSTGNRNDGGTYSRCGGGCLRALEKAERLHVGYSDPMLRGIMDVFVHPRFRVVALWKQVREQSRDSIYARFEKRLDRFEALLREAQGKRPKRKKSAKIISLMSRANRGSGKSHQ